MYYKYGLRVNFNYNCHSKQIFQRDLKFAYVYEHINEFGKLAHEQFKQKIKFQVHTARNIIF